MFIPALVTGVFFAGIFFGFILARYVSFEQNKNLKKLLLRREALEQGCCPICLQTHGRITSTCVELEDK